MIKVIIVDDHKIVLDGIASMLQSEKDIDIVHLVQNGLDLIPKLKEKEVDIVVLDVNMPEISGVELTEIIKNYFPNIKVLILSMYNKMSYIRKLIEKGVDGYVLKNKGKEELLFAIQSLYNGDEYFGAEVNKTLRASYRTKNVHGEVKLTRREKEILKLIANGDTTPIISEKLHIANSTVETHRRNLIEKTGVRNSKGLVKYAFEHGYA